jgi:type 1 glutamine amidotransferase
VKPASLILVLSVFASGCAEASRGGADAGAQPNVLVFSRTLGFRHDSIATGIAALHALGNEHGFRVTDTEEPSRFNDAELAAFDVVVFLCTTGDVLSEPQQLALEAFIRQGGGFVGVHSASDTEYDWPWYGELVGAYFQAHPAIQSASLVVENTNHPATRGLPSPWIRTDEWYAFRTNPRGTVNVLMRLDEASYVPGAAAMGEDHPIAWSHDFEGGRAFYTALGHTDASYAEPEFRAHLAGAIEWAARVR